MINIVNWIGKYVQLFINFMTYKKVYAFTQTTPSDHKTIIDKQPKDINFKKLKDSTVVKSNVVNSFGKKIDFNKFTSSKIQRCNVVNSDGKFISNKKTYNTLYKDLRNELEEQRKTKYPEYGLSAISSFKKTINIIKELDMTIDIVIKLDTTEIFHYNNSSPKDLSIVTEGDIYMREFGKTKLETSGKRNRCWAHVVAAASSKSLNDKDWKDHLQRDIADETILQYLRSAQRGMEQDDFRTFYCRTGDIFFNDIMKELPINIDAIRNSVPNTNNEFASYHIFTAMICDKDDNAPLKRYGKLNIYKQHGDPDYHDIQDNNLHTLEVAHTDGNHFSFVL